MFLSYERVCQHLAEELSEINKIRWKTIIKYIIGLSLIIVGPFAMLYLSFYPSILAFTPTIFDVKTEDIIVVIARFGIFFIILIGVVIIMNAKSYFQYQYKELIVKTMVKTLIETCQLPDDATEDDLRWNYYKSKKISNRRISSSGLFHLEGSDRAQGRDLIRGKIGSTTFEFAVLTLYRRIKNWKHERRRGRTKKPKYKKKFRGILFLADFNKNFRGHTLLRDRKIKSFSHLKRYFWLAFNSL